MRRREFLWMAGFGWLWPPNWFRRRARIAEVSFRELRRGRDRRRYIWIHGDERTAGEVIRGHMRATEGRAFVVENNRRNVRLLGGQLDPNRMFSRVGAERNLSEQNPTWDRARLKRGLDRLDEDRPKFLSKILPPQVGGLLVALHNNGPGYSVHDETPISDSVALNDPAHPDEFVLCTAPADFEKLAKGPYNVVLQQAAPPEDDGSLSRL